MLILQECLAVGMRKRFELQCNELFGEGNDVAVQPIADAA